MQLSQALPKKNKSPLVQPLLSFICGIYWQNKFECNIIFTTIALLTITLFFLWLSFFIHKISMNKKFSTTMMVYCFFFFSGALLLQNQKNNYLDLLKELENKRFDIVAKVIRKEETPQNNYQENLVVKVQKIKQLKQQQDYKYKNFDLALYLKEPSNIFIGDMIEIKSINIKKTTPKKIITNNPTFNEYLLKENILTTVFTKNLNYTKIHTSVFSLKKWFFEKKQKIFNEIKLKLSNNTFKYFSYIFLGNKKDKSITDIRKQFNNWGISHYLARSGLHIILFILIWKFLLYLIPIRLSFKHIMLLFICIFYQLLSWSSISFARAFYVFIIYEVGKLLNKQTNFIHILSLICLFILITNPIQLFFVDFQLSFALTFALAFFNQITKENTLKEQPN